MTLRVAVTGVSGDVGRGAVRGLRHNPFGAEPIWILGLGAGEFSDPELDRYCPLPLVRHPDYVDALLAALRRHEIDVLLPGIDAEIVVLSSARARFAGIGTRVVIAPPELVEAADDKLLTALFLSARGVRTPASYEPDAAGGMSFPIIAKPRRGHGSQGIHILADGAALQMFIAGTPADYCLQQYVEGPEFTVGFLYDSQGIMRDAVATERTLAAGRTVRARVTESPDMQNFIANFGEKVRGIGAINAQLRWHDTEGPLVFEVNARLSGSTEMRVAVGCNDPLRLARHFGRGDAIERAQPRIATVFRRGSELWVEPC